MSSAKPFGEGNITAEDDAKLREYTWDEIRKHNTEEDLWVVLHGRVFDVTEFQIDHPGGPDVLQDIAAQDATQEFESIMHTKKARNMARCHLIGKVKGAKLTSMKQQDDSKQWDEKEIEPTSMNTIVTIGILVVAAGLAYQFYLKDRL
mmetsp:Transcript_73159/g.116656  ORF Transcript_73159/g.116656 Transcript_73159/m.116656 type:complete len:148 (+) Transcript_73159:107-550(+)|eukprot:CAMPEP_0197026864 /NCGR_PEP_ID=MMETSP1384-20130603/6876_1 /TAXON_ID=29189 /ORGANISM="Ammonia sp." /LENGTH=147 /DNA_ID=CAMNT_0042455617 /DNA_START=91 /DNA_END=534 /DNA_ORIENTATION=+